MTPFPTVMTESCPHAMRKIEFVNESRDGLRNEPGFIDPTMTIPLETLEEIK